MTQRAVHDNPERSCIHYRSDPTITHTRTDGVYRCLNCSALLWSQGRDWRLFGIYRQVTEANAQKARAR